MAVLNGSSAKLYITTGAPSSLTDAEVRNVISVDPSFNMEEIDVTHNSSLFFKNFLPGDIDGTVSFTCRYDNDLVSPQEEHRVLIEEFENRRTFTLKIVPVGGIASSTPRWTGTGFLTSFSNPIAHSQGIDITFTFRFNSTISLVTA